MKKYNIIFLGLIFFTSCSALSTKRYKSEATKILEKEHEIYLTEITVSF